MSKHHTSEEMQRQFDNLARVTRAWASARRPREQAPGWLALERAMRTRTRARAHGRWAGAVAAGVAAVALVVWLGSSTPPSGALGYRVSGGDVGRDGAIAAAGTARLDFSDGSVVVLQPQARGRVLTTSARGARLRLDDGSAHLAIEHRPGTEWSVVAGPFTVTVHGTIFDVAWSAGREALEVGLVAGAVSVRGPLAAGPVSLRPGQRLIAHARTGQTRLAEPVAAPEAAAPDVDVAPVEPVPPALAPDPTPAPAAPRHVRRTSVRSASATWAARVASGAFQGVVADAETLGVERCLAAAPASSLAALADAARFARRPELARRALLAERRRFAGTTGAHDAAFLLGRLAADAGGDENEALTWYDRYLAESHRARTAVYAAEARGRRMLALEHLGRMDEARAAAHEYLRVHPDGPHARRAEHLTGR